MGCRGCGKNVSRFKRLVQEQKKQMKQAAADKTPRQQRIEDRNNRIKARNERITKRNARIMEAQKKKQ